MATHRFLFSLSILLGFVAIAASARPCKTFVFITTTSSYYIDRPDGSNSALFRPISLSFFSEVRRIDARSALFDDQAADDVHEVKKRPISDALSYQFGQSAVTSSIRERTMDIMSVVGALLFGVGCGALTAATMFLVWSLFSARRDYCDESENDESDDGDFSPKKIGYVSIPLGDSDSSVKADVKVPLAKEVV